MKRWSVGQLAELAGVTVRTLHYYEEIDLLTPAYRTSSGYRVYTDTELARLARIVALRQMGLSLDEVRKIVTRATPLADVLDDHIDALKERIDEQQRVVRILEDLRERLSQGEDPDDVQQLLEVMTMTKQYFTNEQLEELEQRREAFDPEEMTKVQREWEELFAGFREALENDVPVEDPEVQRLAKRSIELIAMFTGGNPGIARSLDNLYAEQGPAPLQAHGMDVDQALWEYMGRARELAS